MSTYPAPTLWVQTCVAAVTLKPPPIVLLSKYPGADAVHEN